jgi:hypothetical protein
MTEHCKHNEYGHYMMKNTCYSTVTETTSRLLRRGQPPSDSGAKKRKRVPFAEAEVAGLEGLWQNAAKLSKTYIT